jgi:dipeptidyl aminopeptidase/acylaminoacyl peptidase
MTGIAWTARPSDHSDAPVSQALRFFFGVGLVLALSCAGSISAGGLKRSITVPDVLSLREITAQQMSSDGRNIAFIVKDADGAANDYKHTLYVIPVSGDAVPKELLSSKSLSNLRWAPGNDAVTYIATQGSIAQIWKVSAAGGPPSVLFPSEESISEFEWSPDGRTIAFVSAAAATEKETSEAAAKGIVFDDNSTFGFWRFITHSWVSKPTKIWAYSLEQHQTRKLWEQERSRYFFENVSVSGLAWSPDSQSLAVTYNTSASTSKDAAIAFDSGIGLLRAAGGDLEPLPSTDSFQGFPSWSPDGRTIAYIGEVETGGKPRNGFRMTLFVQTLAQKTKPYDATPDVEIRYGTRIWWTPDGKNLLYELTNREGSALYETSAQGGPSTKISRGEEHLTEFSFSGDLRTASCVTETSMKPPELAVVSRADGSVAPRTHLNAAFEQIGLGEVSRVSWKNKFGYSTYGYLIKPIGYKQGQRYPLVVILYGFYGSFITQAEWISSYPAQVFAADGFAVLLMTQPKEYGWHFGNFEEFSFDRDYNALASIDAAVDMLDQMGIADPKRAGIMGWSYGSELTNLEITHSNLFRAASAGSGGANNPGDYWLGGGPFEHYMEGTMGGSPYGKYDKRFDDLSPVLRAEHASTALLIESSPSEMLWSLEFYTKLKRMGKPVELVIYPDEGHIYSQPVHRLASMQRNLDWFRFWLQSYEDPQPEKQEQYRLWRSLDAPVRREGAK